jgi:hypothetical protein
VLLTSVKASFTGVVDTSGIFISDVFDIVKHFKTVKESLASGVDASNVFFAGDTGEALK